MAEYWLVCEGETDRNVLSPLLRDVLGAPITVEVAGGITNLAAVANYLRRDGGIAAFLEDREYRPLAESLSALTDGRPRFLLRRHSIENYLLEPPVLLAAFERLRDRFNQSGTSAPNWISQLPTDRARVIEMVSTAATPLVPQEAGSRVIERLWRESRESLGAIQRRFPTVLRRAEAASEDMCRQAVLEEAARLQAAASDAASLPDLDSSSLTGWYQEEVQRCTSAVESSSLECIHNFDGKRLLRAVVQTLPQNGRPVSFKSLQETCAEALVEEYRQNRNLFGEDDEFAALAIAIQQLSPASETESAES